jgi:hypothetical protein
MPPTGLPTIHEGTEPPNEETTRRRQRPLPRVIEREEVF